MPIPDPASLNVALTISGLSNSEMTTVVNNLPAGATATLTVRKPAVGGKRFEVAAEGLSIQGARDVAVSLHKHLESVAEGGKKPIVVHGYCPQCIERCETDHGQCFTEDGRCTEDFAGRQAVREADRA